MTARSSSPIKESRYCVRSFAGLFLFCVLLANAHGATSLATQPFTSSDSIRALPNVMFVLDDSGSMQGDFLPDWAGPYQRSISAINTVVTPAHRFFNNAYNGVAYNPGTRYRPPTMFASTGAPDTATYPSMTGESVATGGDSTASAASRNWKAVRSDGYGIQTINGIPPTGTSNLEGNAFSYTTIAGEYCDSAQLRNCVASAAPTGSYTFPATLRWCTTPAKAIASTADSNTFCQAGNIDSTPANLTAGVTHYTYPRMPGPPTAVIKVEAAGTVTGITVSGQQILSASASAIAPDELVVEIAKRINACTLAVAGSCSVAGYSAVSQTAKIRTAGSDVDTHFVTIFAPVATSATPVITGGGSTTVFAFGTVPGSVLNTQITSLVDSYPYPGALIKGENRKDCAGTTCTYNEEMTNYANWYAYYRTRMQMMKTASSIAFSGVDEKFRVGYFSINNAAGTQFLNVAPFDGVQKNLWYSSFLRAVPSGETPLRLGLANAGRYFANKQFQSKSEPAASATFSATLNGVAATDPMQYSCQQNFTILSTDGYWDREGIALQNPRRLDDGTQDIGQQDNNLPRPYYDGGTWTKVSSQTLWHEEQWGLNEFQITSMTQQQQTSTEQLRQVVTTTTTYPYRLDTTPLQTRTTPLIQTDSWLNQTEYPLYITPTVLTRYTQYYQKTSEPLNVTTNKLRVRSTKLNRTSEYRVVQTSTPLQAKTYKITATDTDLIRTTYLITKVTSQLQKNSLVSTNGGDSWNWTGYANDTSCTARANSLPATDAGGGVLVREVLCRYVTTNTETGQSSCTITAPSTGPVFSVANPVACTYEGGTTSTVTGSFTTAPKQTSTANNAVYATAMTYAYATTPKTPLTGQNNCTTVTQSTGSPWVGPARSCGWDTAATSTTDATGICTDDTPAITGSGTIVRTVCGYTGTSATATVDTCTVARSTGSPYSVLTKVDCAYSPTNTSQNDVPSCIRQSTSASGTAVGTNYLTTRACSFSGTTTTSATGGADSCTWSGGQSGNTFTAPRVECDYHSTTASVTSANASTCTNGTASTGTAPTTVWNKYDSCSFGTASTPANQNLSSCSTSGGISGADYTGPRVTCSYMPTQASAVDPACAASGTAFVTPLVTCGYAASGPAVLVVGTCTASAAGATGATCAYGTGVPSNNVATCSVVSQTPVAGVYTGPARDCTYVDQAPQSIGGACVVKPKDAGVNKTGPARACSYGTTPASYTLATAACSPVAQAGFVGPAVECAYNGTVTSTPMGSDCSSFAADPGAAFNILEKKVCVAAISTTVVPVTTDPVVTCDATPTSVVDPVTNVTVSTATACTYNPATVQDTPTCTAGGGVVGPFSTTRVSCTITNPGKAYVASLTCTPAGSLSPDIFDASGKIVDCKRTDIRGTAAVFEFVPPSSCPGGQGLTVDGALNQTQCTLLVNTAPVPEDPVKCPGDVAGTPPSYKSTFCTPNPIPTVTATNCANTPPVAPQWITTTCTPNADGTKDTLADIAAYYYYNDLRTSALGNCTGALIPPATVANDVCLDNVFTTSTDPSSFQHMTTFTLGLGASGYMKYTENYSTPPTGDFATVYGNFPHTSNDGINADPANGVCSWQSAGACNWPYPASNEQTTIDDLWHAGVNGHGAYFSATNPDSLSKSIVNALEGIKTAGGATAAPTVSNPSLIPADSYIFSSTYKSVEWTGELKRYQLDPFTGNVITELDSNGKLVPTTDFAVQSKLDAKAPLRNIYVFDSSVATTNLKAFTSANFAANAYFLAPHMSVSPTGLTQFLCASQDTCLSATNQTNASGANLIDYLRGVRTHEGALDDNNKYYRERQHVLGDMVNAQAVYVNKPLYNYADPRYSTFVAAQSSRQAVVYAGANDGMLHAFAAKGNAATETAVEAAAAASSAAFLDPTSAALALAASTAKATATSALASDTLIGQELWAYIPTMVMPNLYKLADKKYKDNHRYFVDATPVVADICISDCTSASLAEWRTILVGGLGGGGRGYYALDITDPTNPKALWEFTNANMGYSYGNPQIAKQSDGTWVVLVTSGYNNIPEGSWATGDGVGRLFVINAATGALVRTLSTGVGDTTNPSGLAKITAQVVNPSSDNTVEAVYGGDLLGNLWRFDINNTIGATGYDAQLLSTLKDASNKVQPITTKPEVGLIPKVNVKVVFVGTGRFLHPDDASDTSQQSLYAIKDVRATGTTPGTAIYNNPGGDRSATRSALGFIRQVQSEIDCPVGSTVCDPGSTTSIPPRAAEKVRTSTNNPVDFVLDSGWYVDLLGPNLDGQSERANTDPALALGLLAFNTNSPSIQACDLGGKSYSYFLNYLTGGPIYAAGNGDPLLNNGVIGRLLANQFSSAPTLVVTKTGKLIIVSGLAGGGIIVSEPPLPPPASITRRTSWRELIRE